MKKVILASVMAVAAISSMSGVAHATTQQICAGAAGNGSVPSNATDGTLFVRAAFSPKCSNNVLLYGDDMVTYYRTGAASTKGNQSFAGSTNGGSIVSVGTCASTGCVAGDASAAVTAGASS